MRPFFFFCHLYLSFSYVLLMKIQETGNRDQYYAKQESENYISH